MRPSGVVLVLEAIRKTVVKNQKFEIRQMRYKSFLFSHIRRCLKFQIYNYWEKDQANKQKRERRIDGIK